MMKKIKNFLINLVQGVAAIFVLTGAVCLLMGVKSAIDFDGGQAEVEDKAEAAAYRAELEQKGYKTGYGEGYDDGYHNGYERGYIKCLEDNNMEWKIDKFLDSK